jgi:hypothetical protein
MKDKPWVSERNDSPPICRKPARSVQRSAIKEMLCRTYGALAHHATPAQGCCPGLETSAPTALLTSTEDGVRFWSPPLEKTDAPEAHPLKVKLNPKLIAMVFQEVRQFPQPGLNQAHED